MIVSIKLYKMTPTILYTVKSIITATELAIKKLAY